MKRLSIICVLLATAPLLGQGTDEKTWEEAMKNLQKEGWNPPSVKVGRPPLFNGAKYNLDHWKKKTIPGPRWFTTLPTGDWFIDWDVGRQPFDLIVIHATGSPPNMTADQLSEIRKKDRYAIRFQSESAEPYVKGLPVHSGHVVNNQETFIVYHHLVYGDGKITTELLPIMPVLPTAEKEPWRVGMVAWHTENRAVNRRSISIGLVGQFFREPPPIEQVGSTIRLITYYRQFNPELKVAPHASNGRPCAGLAWPILAKTLKLSVRNVEHEHDAKHSADSYP